MYGNFVPQKYTENTEHMKVAALSYCRLATCMVTVFPRNTLKAHMNIAALSYCPLATW